MNQFLGMKIFKCPGLLNIMMQETIWLIEHGRSDAVRLQIPPVLRPDLIPHADGLALTEWDSVPGGIGLTAHLEAVTNLANAHK